MTTDSKHGDVAEEAGAAPASAAELTRPGMAGSLVDLQLVLNRARSITFRQITGALLTLLDLKRPDFGVHCRRIAQWSQAIGQMGGFTPDEIPALEAAALLHDIGFIVVMGDHPFAGRALDRGRSTPTHEMVGYAVLNEIPGFERIAEAVLHHHEHYDGTGRPLGLRGEKIPLMSRVIAVADYYDTEIHPGLGMLATGEEAARRALLSQRGHRLDPDLVSRILFAETNLDPIRRQGKEEFEITPTALMPGMILSRDLRTLDNVLLLAADTALTREQINRLLSSDKLEWLVVKAHVDARSIKEKEMSLEERRREPVAVPAADFGWMAPAGKARATVLALDDSMAVNNAIRRELGRSGIEVIGFSNVEAALQQIEAHRFDAAITDIAMSEADGFAFLNELKARQHKLYVVVLSGYPSAENIRALREFQNVVRFVTKPWSEQILLASVEEAIALTRDAIKQ